MTHGYSLKRATAELQRRHWISITESALRQHLADAGLIYRDLSGDWLTTTRADRRLIFTRYGHYPKPMPDGTRPLMHSASVKITDDGIDWLAARIQREVAA